MITVRNRLVIRIAEDDDLDDNRLFATTLADGGADLFVAVRGACMGIRLSAEECDSLGSWLDPATRRLSSASGLRPHPSPLDETTTERTDQQ